MQKPTGKNLTSWSLFPHCLNHVKKQLETAETLPLLYHKANNYKYHPDILGKYGRSRQIIKVKADNKYNIYYSKNKYIEKLWRFTFIPNKTINESLVAFCHIKVVFEHLLGILLLNKLLRSSLRSENMIKVLQTPFHEETG